MAQKERSMLCGKVEIAKQVVDLRVVNDGIEGYYGVAARDG